MVAVVRALTAAGDVIDDVLAEDGTEGAAAPVGHVRLSRGWVDARARLVEVAVLSPLSVVPRAQGGGLGRRLVETAVQHAEDAGLPAVFLEGDWRYYGRLGFVAAGPLGFGRPSARIPAPAFQVRLLRTHEPWMTGRLVYPDAFWRTDTVGLRDPLLGEIEASLTAD